MIPNYPNKKILEYIQNNFDYEPLTGDLWRSTGNRKKIQWKLCLSEAKNRYRVRIRGTDYQVTNICWFLHYNKWPTFEVDHKDRNGFNNKVDNLRKATCSQNGNNKDRRIYNKYYGVSYHSIGDKWRYRFIINKTPYEVYGFVSAKDAAIAREAHLDQLGDTFCARNTNLE